MLFECNLKVKWEANQLSLDCYFMLWLWGYWDGKTSELLNFVCFLEILPLCMYKSPQLFPSRKDKHGKQMSPRTGSSEGCCLSLRWLVPAIQGFHFPRYHLSTVIIFLFFYFFFLVDQPVNKHNMKSSSSWEGCLFFLISESGRSFIQC